MHVFVVTNDFPPRIGGINYYVDQLMRRFPPGSVTVFSSRYQGWEVFDAAYPHEVIRLETEMMLPVPGSRYATMKKSRLDRPLIYLKSARHTTC